MSTIGPKTQQQGYWGLAWPDTLTGIAVHYLVNGYQINVMKSLLPLVYNLHELAGQTGSILFGPPSWAQYSWDFGSGEATSAPNQTQTDWSGYLNLGYWEVGSVTTNYPSSAVMQNDLLDLGANPFEIFSGIDGWGGANGTVYYPNLDCNEGVVTLFNATPKELWVEWTTLQGVLSAPNGTAPFNYNTSTGFAGTAWSELRPYGYTTMFYAPSSGLFNSNPSINTNVWDYNFSSTQSVGSFDLNQSGCDEAQISAGPYSTDGYGWAASGTKGGSSGAPGGYFATLINSSIPPK